MGPGDVLDARFELTERARGGGMSTVYRAFDRSTGKTVAIKTLRDAEPGHAERLLREANVLYELDHPALVRYIAHGKTPEGEPFLAMEWLEGVDLARRLARQRLALRDGIEIVRRIAHGLSVAHARGIVHRDVKPSNVILVEARPELAKLIDFGVARLERSSTTLTRTGAAIGTPGYMAPEQARGAKNVDARADVFALGCVLFHCVTGRAAFEADSVLAVLAKVVFEEAPRPSELEPQLPTELDELIVRMLSKDPARRPSDAGSVARELEALDLTRLLVQPRQPEPRDSLTAREQIVASVVVVSSTSSPVDDRTRSDSDESDRLPSELTGIELERLSDGTLVGAAAGGEHAADQAARVARAALALRRLFPGRTLAVATGRGMLLRRLPVGEAIDRASAQLALPVAPDAIRIDDVTAGLLGAGFEISGDAQGLLLDAELGDRAPIRTLLGKPTPCVGRRREIGALVSSFEQCAEEQVARVALVTGAAGIGKSRVRYELANRIAAAAHRAEIWLARADAMSAGSTFGLLAQLVRRAAAVRDGEPLELRQKKLHARVALRLPPQEVDRVSEFLGELSGTPFPDDDSLPLRTARHDPRLMGDQMRRAWEDFVVAECRAQPLVVLLEDLHWGDPATVSYIDSTLRRARELPLFVVAIARPDVHDRFPRLWHERGVHEIRLSELTRAACIELVREALPASVDRDIAERLAERSAGNALYLEELIRAVADDVSSELPQTVAMMVQARLQALEPEARRVLRAASVFGRAFWDIGVRELLGDRGREEAERFLSVLCEREVVTRLATSQFPGGVEYVFRHSLVREAAYASLTDQDRRLGHALAGQWLERMGGGDAITIAEHFERGGDEARSARWYRRAAEHALGGNDFQAAISCATRAARAGLGQDELGALRLLEAEARLWRGQTAEAESLAERALALLPRGSERWYESAGMLATAHLRRGNRAALSELLGVLEAEPAADHARAERVSALARLATAFVESGAAERGAAILAQIADAECELESSAPSAAAQVFYARGHHALATGDVEGSVDWFTRSASCFETAGDLRSACVQRINVSAALVLHGLFEEARPILDDAHRTAIAMQLDGLVPVILQNLSLADAGVGRLDEAHGRLMDSISAASACSDRRSECYARAYMAKTLFLLGQFDAAESEARRSIDSSAESPAAQAQALATLARVLLATDRVADACEHAARAQRLIETHAGLEEGEALVRLVFAEALAAAGDRNGAQHAVARARRRIEQRAARIRNHAWRSKFLQIPENARTLELARELEK